MQPAFFQYMMEWALSARRHAYAPYSHFQVGAALRCADGTVFTGCNVENASYSMTICAERNAVAQAILKGKHQFSAIAIAGGNTETDAKNIPCPPCGACLQVLAEFCNGDFPVLLADGVNRLSELLPQAFQLKPSQERNKS
jgi:cytidine deaminase